MKIHLGCQLVHIYGPFAIHSYGLFIALSVLVGISLMRRNKRFFTLHLADKYTDIVLISIAAGVVGGRVLAILSEPSVYANWKDYLSLWEGGFSILGTILGITLCVPFYLKKIHVPILPLCDFVSIYAPLMQSIARLGCFFAGCCHGIPTNSIFGVIYTNPNTMADCGIPVHPTQLYSSCILFACFLFMYFFAQYKLKRPGQLFVTYLMLVSAERFFVDFWRSDRIINNGVLSFHQQVALVIFCLATLAHIALFMYSKHSKPIKYYQGTKHE